MGGRVWGRVFEGGEGISSGSQWIVYFPDHSFPQIKPIHKNNEREWEKERERASFIQSFINRSRNL